MRKAMLVVMMSAMIMVGCGRREAPVPTLDSPQPTILEEHILEETILEENVITWDSDSVQRWD